MLIQVVTIKNYAFLLINGLYMLAIHCLHILPDIHDFSIYEMEVLSFSHKLVLGNILILSLIVIFKCQDNEEIFQYRNIACTIYNITVVNNMIILRIVALKYANFMLSP